MTDKAAEQIFEEMNLSNILVAILDSLKEVNVSRTTFLEAGKEDKEMQVSYDSDTDSFLFKLREKKSEEEELINDFE